MTGYGGLRPRNRISIRMVPKRGNVAELESLIDRLGVPREALKITVGCGGGPPKWPLGEARPPSQALLDAIEYSLNIPLEVPYGETVPMNLVLRNVSTAPVEFYMGGRPSHTFVVTKSGGKKLWQWCGTGVVKDILDIARLQPGATKEFVGEWEQVDDRGDAVTPGEYLVYASMDMEWPEVLVTEALRLRIGEPGP